VSTQLSNGLLARRRRINESAPLPDPTYAYGGQSYTTGIGSSVNLTLNNLGSDYANRYVFIGISYAGSADITDLTIGGQPASIINDVGTSPRQVLAIAKVPSGSSAIAAVTFSGTVGQAACTWGVLNDLQSMTPVSQGTASGANTTSVNVSIPAKARVVAYWRVSYGASPDSTSWSVPMGTSMNENFGTQQRHSLAWRSSSIDVASYNVTNTFNYSTTRLNVAVFR